MQVRKAKYSGTLQTKYLNSMHTYDTNRPLGTRAQPPHGPVSPLYTPTREPMTRAAPWCSFTILHLTHTWLHVFLVRFLCSTLSPISQCFIHKLNEHSVWHTYPDFIGKKSMIYFFKAIDSKIHYFHSLSTEFNIGALSASTDSISWH